VVRVVQRGAALQRFESLALGHGSCASAGGWVAQQILGGGQVVVPRDRADLPLAEFGQRRRLQPLRVGVCVVDRQYVVGLLNDRFQTE
jgi:hypothetical protein